MADSKKSAKKSHQNTMLRIGVLSSVVLVLSGVIYFLYVRGNNSPKILEQDQQTSERILQKLGKSILLNSESTPTVAQIHDTSALKKRNPEFYADVEKNDYVILYPERAIIYRESNDLIVNIADTSDDLQLMQDTKASTGSE